MRWIRGAAKSWLRQIWIQRNASSFGRATAGEKPRLLVDVSAIIRSDAQTGIQRVVRAVWADLRTRTGHGFDVVPVFATDTHGYCYAPVDFLNDGIPSERVTVGAGPGDTFLGLDLSAHLLPKYRRQVRAWRTGGATVHLVVYDLLPLLRPEWFNPAAGVHFQRWFRFLRQEADQAICISDEVARDLGQRLAGTAEKNRLAIRRLSMGGDISASLPSTGISDEVSRLLRLLTFRPAVLMVGTVEPRKGYEAALEAFEHLWQTRPAEAPDLVIVGKAGWKTAALQAAIRTHPEQGRRLHWVEGASDEALCQLYEAARAVLMASYGEGFGLPLIEAAMHRRHVLARDLPVFREQRLNSILYFSDDRPEALGASVMELMKAAMAQPAAAFALPTWTECVDDLLCAVGLAEIEQGGARPLLQAS